MSASIGARLTGVREESQCRTGTKPSTIQQVRVCASLAGLIDASRSRSPALDNVALFPRFVLERDLHLGAIGDHIAVVDLHVEVGHFGNSQVAQR